MLENTEGAMERDNPEKRQHRVHKTQGKYMLVNIDGVAKQDNPETLAT